MEKIKDLTWIVALIWLLLGVLAHVFMIGDRVEMYKARAQQAQQATLQQIAQELQQLKQNNQPPQKASMPNG